MENIVLTTRTSEHFDFTKARVGKDSSWIEQQYRNNHFDKIK